MCLLICLRVCVHESIRQRGQYGENRLYNKAWSGIFVVNFRVRNSKPKEKQTQSERERENEREKDEGKGINLENVELKCVYNAATG